MASRRRLEAGELSTKARQELPRPRACHFQVAPTNIYTVSTTALSGASFLENGNDRRSALCKAPMQVVRRAYLRCAYREQSKWLRAVIRFRQTRRGPAWTRRRRPAAQTGQLHVPNRLRWRLSTRGIANFQYLKRNSTWMSAFLQRSP